MRDLTPLLFFLGYAIVLSAALARAGYRAQAAPPNGAPRPGPSRILIVGATGGTGRQLVTQALERGHAVTALVRNPSRLRVDHPRLTVIQGDVLDEQSVDRVMHGQEAVLSALGHKRFFYPTRILSKGTRNILRAMETHGVRRLVCETALGIGDSAGRLGLVYTFFVIPAILPFYFWDKTRQERMLAAQRRGVGHRAARGADERRQEGPASSWSSGRKLSLDGARVPRGRRGLHAEPACGRHVPAGGAGAAVRSVNE